MIPAGIVLLFLGTQKMPIYRLPYLTHPHLCPPLEGEETF
jgi:hypothetical protein